MKLLKYFLFLIILSTSIYFLIELNEINMVDGNPIKIKIPFIEESSSLFNGFSVWVILLMTFTLGVVLGFVISLIQMISLKSETITLKSKNKKIQIELDALRNQGIDEDIDIPEDININEDKFTL